METVTIKIPGNTDVKLSVIEFNALVQALEAQVRWDVGGMFGDGEEIIDKPGMARAKRVLKKLAFQVTLSYL